MNRLFLLDGMALVYRAHFAFIRSPIFTTDGFNTSAIVGFTNTLVDLLKNQKPTHIGVVFDTSAPTFRHTLFPEYKAQRDSMPEDLSNAIPGVKRIVEAFDIPVVTQDGFEADDIIGTLAKLADQSGQFETFMVTPDKDFAQLVSPHTKIYKPGRSGNDVEILGVEDILTKWEITDVSQVVDILGLWGDTSDNIPGIPGIGEKTAKKLVTQFGSLEALLENTPQLKGKLKENVESHAGQARLSKTLVTIDRDVPLTVTFDDLKLGDPDESKLKAVLAEFELNAIGKRLFGPSFDAGRARKAQALADAPLEKPKSISDTEHAYSHITTREERAGLIAQLAALDAFCFDCETSSLDPKSCTLLGIAFSWEPHRAAYVAFPNSPDSNKATLEEFRPIFENERSEKIGHNLKFDLGVLLAKGVRVAGPLFDTMLVHALAEPDQRHGMDFLSESYLHYKPVPISDLIGKRGDAAGQLSLETVAGESPDQVADYAAEDADVTWQLAGKLKPILEERGQQTVYDAIEAPVLPVLTEMELTGFALDVPALAEIGVKLGDQIEDLEEKIFRQAGTRFNLNSPKQLGEVLFDQLHLLDNPKKTATGQYKTDEQILLTLAPKHPIVADILAYRESTKLKSTYVDALPAAIFPGTGRVHTTFHQLLTATGRLASSNPNLQNIPVRSEQGREIRTAFVPGEPGWKILSADYSQIELRIMASLSGDQAMSEAFLNNLDIHSATAARVFGVNLDSVTPDMRRKAKMVNFGIIYGISAFGLSQRLGIPRSEAAEIISGYFENYPGVKNYMERTVEDARTNGYVETVTGRRRYLRDINSSSNITKNAAERIAINTPIQGTAADMIKLAMINVHAALRSGNFRTRMLLQVHDELVFEMPPDEAPNVVPAVTSAMRDALPMNVPIVVDSGIGDNWLEAH